MASVTAELAMQQSRQQVDFQVIPVTKSVLSQGPSGIGNRIINYPIKTPKRIYLIGSLRNQEVQVLAGKLRALGYEVFDDWHAAGPEADDYWQKYEIARGRTYKEALSGAAAKNVYQFDKRNLDASDVCILVMPAGKSGHLELGYCCGQGKHTAVFFPEDFVVERYDVMYQFAEFIAENEAELIDWVKGL